MKMTPLKNPRCEKIYKNRSRELDELCFRAAKVYNVTLYVLRQLFFDRLDNVPEYTDLVETDERGYHQIGDGRLVARFRENDQQDFRALPSLTAQGIVRMVYTNWWASLKCLRDRKEHPEKYQGLPQLMRYKHKERGRFVAPFFRIQLRYDNGRILFPDKAGLAPLRTRLTEKPQMARVIPLRVGRYKIELVYERPDMEAVEVDQDRVIAIDPNVKCLCMVVNNFGDEFFYINGRPLIAINQYFSKKLVLAMSFVGGRGRSRRIHRLHHRHNLKVENFVHQVTRHLVNYCLENKVGKVYFGKIRGWKQRVELGKVNNQQFVQIPYNRIVHQLEYKLMDCGIGFEVVDEGYTSKADNLALEPFREQETYSERKGKKFVSKVGLVIHSDVNDAIGVMRKGIGDACVSGLLDRGGGFTPVKTDLPMRF